MIEEPYRWVEAVANRREYIEGQLRQGSPVVLANYEHGLLLLTASHETRKLFEVYDRIAFAALGHPADIEQMRLVAIDLAHVEGFNRAVKDVSLRRLVNYGMSPALKTAFEQIHAAPYIVKMVLAELGDDPEHDLIIKLDYDGSFTRTELEMKEPFDVLAGTDSAEKVMLEYLVEHGRDAKGRGPLEDTVRLAARAWAVGMSAAERGEGTGEERPAAGTADDARVLKEYLKNRRIEAGVLDRNRPPTGQFRLLDEKEIRAALKDL